MIRIVTAGRLRRMSEEVEQSRTRARAVQGQADTALARHLQQVWELTARAEKAEAAASAAGWDKDVAEAAVKVLREEADRPIAALEGAEDERDRRGELIERLSKEMEAAKRAGRSLVLLLHYGEPRSIHRSAEAARERVAALDPAAVWGPRTDRPACEVAWRMLDFTAEEGGSDYLAA